jgi:hypothetical protein
MHGNCIEAVVDRDIPGKRVKFAPASIPMTEPQPSSPSPTRQCERRYWRRHRGNHAVAVDALACLDQLQRELDFHRIECRRFQLVADTDALSGPLMR